MRTKGGNCDRRLMMSSRSRWQRTADDSLFSSKRRPLFPGRSFGSGVLSMKAA